MQPDLGEIVSMAVVPLTLCISLTLTLTFVVFFLLEHSRKRFSSTERDSLLPLAEENRQLPQQALPSSPNLHV